MASFDLFEATSIFNRTGKRLFQRPLPERLLTIVLCPSGLSDLSTCDW